VEVGRYKDINWRGTLIGKQTRLEVVTAEPYCRTSWNPQWMGWLWIRWHSRHSLELDATIWKLGNPKQNQKQ
jgi:hypothetical protein